MHIAQPQGVYGREGGIVTTLSWRETKFVTNKMADIFNICLKDQNTTFQSNFEKKILFISQVFIYSFRVYIYIDFYPNLTVIFCLHDFDLTAQKIQSSTQTQDTLVKS